MNFLNGIYLLTGLCAASLVWVSMLRRHLRNQRTIARAAEEIAEQKRRLAETRDALRQVYYRVYHREIFPDICRAEGVINLELMLIEKVIADSNMAQRPEHHKYNRLVNQQLIEMRDILLKGHDEITRLKNRFQDIMTQFSHLQE